LFMAHSTTPSALGLQA